MAQMIDMKAAKDLAKRLKSKMADAYSKESSKYGKSSTASKPKLNRPPVRKRTRKGVALKA